MFSELCSEWNPPLPRSQVSELTHLSCARTTWEARATLPSVPRGLASLTPLCRNSQRLSTFGAARSWHSALVVPPLPGECVGRLQLRSCLARGKERREMSRWIYLEPDLPPTASEGASGRARSQAREREVGEGDPGTSKGWGAGEGAAGCPNTSHMSAFTLQQPLPSHQGQERIFWGPPAPQRVSFSSSPWHPGPSQLSLQQSERGVHQSLENELLWLQCNQPRRPNGELGPAGAQSQKRTESCLF